MKPESRSVNCQKKVMNRNIKTYAHLKSKVTFSSERDLLLVIKGYSGDNGSEVIDFKSPNGTSNCQVGNFTSSEGAALGIVNNTMTLFSGSRGYEYDPVFADWSTAVYPSCSRYDTPTVFVNGAMWLTGDTPCGHTSEFYSNGSFTQGPDFPMEVEHHCFVNIDDRHFMLVGMYPWR